MGRLPGHDGARLRRARRALLATTGEWAQWRPLLEERFYRRGAYLVGHDDIDWESTELRYHIPDPVAELEPGAWHSRDALIVPLAHSDGHLLGILSVDEPVSGRRPTDEELDLLTAVATQAARAIEHGRGKPRRGGRRRRSSICTKSLRD